MPVLHVVSIFQIKNWKEFVKKKYELMQKILETKTSQYTCTSDVLKRLVLQWKKRSEFLENC